MPDILMIAALVLAIGILFIPLNNEEEERDRYKLLYHTPHQTVRLCYFLDGKAYSVAHDYPISEAGEAVVHIDLDSVLDYIVTLPDLLAPNYITEEDACCQSNLMGRACDCPEPRLTFAQWMDLMDEQEDNEHWQGDESSQLYVPNVTKSNSGIKHWQDL